MKKIFTFLVVAVAFISLSYAKKVDENTAKVVGQQFLIAKAVSGQIRTVSDVALSYTSFAPAPATDQSAEPIVCYYVFNINSTQGFVIVSGDDAVAPILGYSNQASFDADHIPPHVAAWLKGYEDQIKCAVSQKMTATPKIMSEWELYKTTTNPKPLYKAPQGVAPLVQTTWNQSPYYNDLCPYDNQAGDRMRCHCNGPGAEILEFPCNGSRVSFLQ